jgi:hypothetical protein
MIIEIIATIFIILLALTILYLKHVYNNLSYQMQDRNLEIAKLQSELTTYSPFKAKKFDGIFEIHITVDAQNNYVKLLEYIDYKKKIRKIKIVHAVSSVGNNQYMLSYFTRKEDDLFAVESAKATANELLNLYNIKVLRVKVESHNVDGTPLTLNDYNNVSKYLNVKYNNECNKPYFEFHCKVDFSTEFEDIASLESDVKSYNGCAISHNLCSANRKPLLTVRVYDEGFLFAQKYKDKVMNDLKSKHYIFDDKIQQEFSIYDSCPNLDVNWLEFK